MIATVYRNGKPETYKIKNFEIQNHSRKNRYISFELIGVLADIIHIDIKDLQEVSIREDGKNDG